MLEDLREERQELDTEEAMTIQEEKTAMALNDEEVLDDAKNSMLWSKSGNNARPTM